ncbi:hypothetical protein GGX14DRAFT_646032 [Mycena pura]|uniref:Uncharacterized protein n=1 Tax=Mycena pura TaxID=153505 RepID=A0AAD6V7K2_9AGAR|nr:hypothetical protein GGX14DRAFT_646032 [Mycena pura]
MSDLVVTWSERLFRNDSSSYHHHAAFSAYQSVIPFSIPDLSPSSVVRLYFLNCSSAHLSIWPTSIIHRSLATATASPTSARPQAIVSQQTASTSQRTATSTGPQTTASQYTFASNKPNESDTVDYRVLELNASNPCLDFYRTNINITPLSCDWENFVPWDCFDVEDGWHDLSEVDFFVKRVAKVQGEIRPLAFLPFHDPCIAFEAGGKYYFLNTATSYLDDFGGDYASDDDFLKALLDPHVEGTRFIFEEGTDDLYKAVDKEQRRRAKAAEKLAKKSRNKVNERYL